MEDTMRECQVCFIVTGEFLTQISRQLWADEREPEKAIKILKEGLHGITMEQVMAILTGSKKLTGNSNDENGVGFDDDDATVSENGFPLGLKDLIARFRAKEDQLEDEVQFFSKNTELVPSPKGLVEVPRRRTKVYHKTTGARVGLREDVDLEKIPHRECNPRVRQEHMTCTESQLKRMEQGLELGEILDDGWVNPESPYDMLADQDMPPSSPPEPEYVITGDCGWLSPEGKFYRCAYQEHISLAIKLDSNEVHLEKLGWIKVQEDEFFKGDFSGMIQEFTVTQAQRDLVFDYCHKKGKPMPYWMEPKTE